MLQLALSGRVCLPSCPMNMLSHTMTLEHDTLLVTERRCQAPPALMF